MEPNQKDRLFRTTALKDAQPMANASAGSHSQIQSVDTSAVSTSHSVNNRKSDILSDAVPCATKLGLNKHIWNWHCKASPDGTMPANFYEASLTPWSNFGSLQGDADCDVVVIGAGLLGASTALHMAEAGLDVVLVEKDDVGSGASGRNGGQLTPGLAHISRSTGSCVKKLLLFKRSHHGLPMLVGSERWEATEICQTRRRHALAPSFNERDFHLN